MPSHYRCVISDCQESGHYYDTFQCHSAKKFLSRYILLEILHYCFESSVFASYSSVYGLKYDLFVVIFI